MASTATEETTKRQMVEDDPAERELETDAGDAFEGAETGEEELEEPTGQTAAFDTKQYEGPLALPKADGESVTKIAVKFAGTVFLDRSDERDVKLMKDLKLGKDITLLVEGSCSKRIEGFTTDREGELDVIVLQRAIKVHTVYQPVKDERA